MHHLPGQEFFNAILPFSLTTDEEGRISMVGRSLSKLLPDLTTGRNFLESFSIIEPSLPRRPSKVQDLLGELVVLQSRANPELRFRGQVTHGPTHHHPFIFAVELSITSMSQILPLGLTLSDFRMGDPVFDYLLFLQNQLRAREALVAAQSGLEWENRTSKLLLKITLETLACENHRDTFRLTVDAVCEALGWEVGHVFLARPGSPPSVESANIWKMSEGSKLSTLHTATQSSVFISGEGLPGRALYEKRVIWVENVVQNPIFYRRDAIRDIGFVTAVEVPVVVDEEVVGILEFFSTSTFPNVNNMYRFFELLALQLNAAISRKRALERDRQNLAALANASKMATLGEISAGIAHEINNPLHTLRLVSSLLHRLGDAHALSPAILKEQLAKVDLCVTRMAKIVSELKDFARESPQDGHEAVAVKDLIEDTLDLCSALLNNRGVRIDIGSCPPEWTIECSRAKLSQVILNLVNNSMDAISNLEDRWIKLDTFDRGDAIEIAVTDSGTRIPDEIAQRIMTPFFTTKPPGKGTGLGLSISSNILTDHGGSLSLDRESENTRFVMRVPKVQDGLSRNKRESPYALQAHAASCAPRTSENSSAPTL